MTNALDTAAWIVDKAWCKGDMIDSTGDSYCANGALIVALGYHFRPNNAGEFDETEVYDAEGNCHYTYEIPEQHEEARVLAKTIIENGGDEYGTITSTIYGFNDNADSHDEVAAMLRKAARNFDAANASAANA